MYLLRLESLRVRPAPRPGPARRVTAMSDRVICYICTYLIVEGIKVINYASFKNIILYLHFKEYKTKFI